MLDKIKQIVQNHSPKPLTNPKASAVFIPLINTSNGLEILYEVRAQHISQPGQTSFPGGGVEEGETFYQAAVRETCEELGVKEADITVFGEVDYICNEHSWIKCFAGFISDSAISNISPSDEVERVFTIPLAFFLENDPKHFTTYYTPDNLGIKLNDQMELKKIERTVTYYELEDESLWGYTAELTESFINLIKEGE